MNNTHKKAEAEVKTDVKAEVQAELKPKAKSRAKSRQKSKIDAADFTETSCSSVSKDKVILASNDVLENLDKSAMAKDLSNYYNFGYKKEKSLPTKEEIISDLYKTSLISFISQASSIPDLTETHVLDFLLNHKVFSEPASE